MGELLARISSRELSEWAAFCKLEPLPDGKADVRAGIIAATVANTGRDPKKRRRPFKPSEFVPQWEEANREQGWEEQLKIVERLNAAFGGRDLRGRDAGDRTTTD